MNVWNLAARAAAATAVAFMAALPAGAQTAAPIGAPTLSFRSSGDRDTWHTVMLVSAVVAIVGVVDNDSTLTVLGGAGILLSLYESDRSRFRLRPGVDLLKMGPMSIGVNPLGQMGLSQGFTRPRPSPYVQLTFRF